MRLFHTRKLEHILYIELYIERVPLFSDSRGFEAPAGDNL